MIKVSVIMPVHNGEATLARALDSIFAQTFTDYEVIVTNDGSTDSTADILKRYAGRLMVIEGERRGNGPARNRAIAQARGDYLAFLDADDTWMPNKLARTIPMLENDSGATLVYSNALVINDRGEVLREHVRPESAHAPTLAEMLSRRWPILESMTVMRKSVLQAIGGFWEEPGAFRANGSYFIFLQARERGHFAYIHEPLTRYLSAPYPDFINRDSEERAFNFARISERYGPAAARRFRRGIKREMRPVHSHYLGHMGLVALSDRRIIEARRLFLRAMRSDPPSLRNLLRLLRTFLPRPVAHALTGRTGADWH
jgi:glycosyltransferase involved in cell wall biosynthesis